MTTMQSGKVGRYVRRLRDAASEKGWAAVGQQLVESVRWRLDPTQIAMRSIMRENADFDRRYGTDTSGERRLDELGIDAAEAQHGNGVYRAIPESHFQAALKLLGCPFEDYTFVDYGSGKGKALLLAAEFPFRHIIGVEYSWPLHEAALANVKRYPPATARSHQIDFVHGDAREFSPPAGPLVCFFFNPFDETVWAGVLRRIQESFDADPRPIHLVYLNVRNVAELPDVFSAFPAFVPGRSTKNCRILSAWPPLADAKRGLS